MKRTIIKIDENLCNGCGNCVTGCHEGALQLIDGKAVMVSELFCDGLGACIGDCPVNAIVLEEREAEPYSESAVMERISKKGEAVILAHLAHLKDHGEKKLLQEGLDWLKEHHFDFNPSLLHKQETLACGCSSSHEKTWDNRPTFAAAVPVADSPSELRQFPVQLHLLNPQAPYFQGANVLLAADCTAFAVGNFHSKYLKGKKLAIACPKLDSNTDRYLEKLESMIDDAQIDMLTVLIMEVPCCGGLVGIAKTARDKAKRHIPIKVIVVSVQGEVKKEEWL
ncbi:MAG TPA: 4Fe-4S dicluster domain-containing protein [Bacteroidales bacterium]|nr:4Fe-4S dicluster domain-containing protein [Bacteroidales bacterium]